MEENEFKPIAKRLLKTFGFKVEDIPCRNSETPDFHVSGKASTYTIELKIKEDDPEEIKKDSTILLTGKILGKEKPTGPRNRLYAIAKKAVDQIKKHDPKNKTFHVIWLHSAGLNPRLLNMRFRASLFGTQDFFSLKRKGLMTCYYFNESVFFSCRNYLDGAILTQDCGSKISVQLCVNTLSHRLETFRDSELYKSLSRALCDPGVRPTKNIIIADCNYDREDKDKIIKYLKEKLNLGHLQTIDMKQYSAKILLPKEESG